MVGLGPSPAGRVRVSCFVFVRAGGCVGQCCWDGSGVLLFEISVGFSHVFASRQILSCCSCRLREVRVEEPVLGPFGKL